MTDAKDTIRQFLKDNALPTPLGDVVVTREIGEGGNGLVFEGSLHETTIAIKVLVKPEQNKLTRFKAEYLNVVLLPSNHFIAKPMLYNEFSTGDEYYPTILLRKYDGHLVRPESPSREDLQKLLRFLLSAIDFIHTHGIIHRDLKPENILIDADTYVIADFGIASYNPDLFLLMADTRRGERVGNRKFSAPEQDEVNVDAHQTMDIYALGQIIQWFATGSIHRGTHRISIADLIPGTEVYDAIVEKCLANEPSRRFQTISEVREFANSLNQAKRIEASFVDPYKYLTPFSEAVSATFPRLSYGVEVSDEKARIDRFISMLNVHDFGTELWWTNGSGNMYCSFKQLSDSTWLMGNDDDGHEVKIQSMWVYHSPSIYGDVVLLNLDAMPQFGIYEEREPEMYEHWSWPPTEEAGLVDDQHYITRSEYDNGYMESGATIIALRGHKSNIRTRTLAPSSIFVGTAFHNILSRASDAQIMAFLRAHPAGKGITKENFEGFADSIGRNLTERLLRFC